MATAFSRESIPDVQPRFKARMSNVIWIPMLAFEVPFAVWLLIKGVAATATR